MGVIAQLQATTRRNFPTKKVRDIYYNKPGVLKCLMDKAHVHFGQGGSNFSFPVENAAINDASVGMYDGGNKNLTYVQDNLVTTLEFEHKFLYTYTFMTDAEIDKNKGPERILNLHDIKVGGAHKAARNLLNNQLIAGTRTNANDIHGLVDIFDITYTTYGGLAAAGGIDLSDTAIGPAVVAIGGLITTMTKEVINQAFNATWEFDMYADKIFANVAFRQQIISLCLDQQRFNEGGGKWTIGPNKSPMWMGMVEVETDRNMSGVAAAYMCNMDLFHLMFAYSGDGMKKSGWYDLRDTVGTIAYVVKAASAFSCNDPHENAKITWTT